MVVKRSHTNANIAPAIWRLREQVNAAYPNRSKVSDGIWPSAAHTAANPNSDHEAGNALDITADLGDGQRVKALYELLKGDRRLSYLIHDGLIWSAERGERAYTGSNPHRTHMHVSVKESRRDDASYWRVHPVERTFKVIGIHTTMSGAKPRDLEFESKLRKLCAEYGKQVREARVSRPLPADYDDWFKIQ